MAISKALSALAGVSRGLKTIVEREEEQTADLTKIGLKQTLENIATARKNHATTMKEFREQMEGVKALQRWKYKDPITGKEVPVTRGQAIALIQATGGVKEANQALQDAEVAFKGEGEVGPISYTTSGAIDQETVEAFTEEDDKVGVAPLSLAKGRGARAMANVQKVVDKLGLPKDGYQTPVGLPEVTGVQIISTKNANGEDVDSIDKGTVTATINGQEQSTFAFLGDDRIFYVKEGNDIVPLSESKFAGGTYTPKVSKTSDDPSDVELTSTYVKDYFQETSFKTQRDAYIQKQASIKVLGEAYNQMGPLATDDTVYSGVAKLAGGLVERARIEFAGVNFVVGNDTEDKYVASKEIQKFDEFIEKNKNIEDPKIKAQVLEAIAGRAAIAYLKASGEDRFSDQDMRRGMAQFVADSPKGFLELARSNWQSQTSEARQMRESLLQHPAFSMYTVLGYDDREQKLLEPVIEQFKPKEMAVNPPYFLAEGYEEEFKKKTEQPVVQDVVEIDVTLNNTTRKATYNAEDGTVTIDIPNKNIKATLTLEKATDLGYISEEQLRELRKKLGR